MSLLNDIRIMLTRWSTAFVLLALLAVSMAGATLVEAKMNPEAARIIIYSAWWFYLLFLLLCVNFILIGQKLRLWQRRRWGALLLHYGFVVTLAGALITHFGGYEGKMHIREGESSDKIVSGNHRIRQVPFSIRLENFNLERYNGSNTPSSYESDVTIEYEGTHREVKIYMNNIARVAGFRIYQSSYDPDERGTILSVNYDPVGTAVSYAGYLLLVIGCIAALVQKGSRVRTLYKTLGKTALLLFLCITAGNLYASAETASPARPIVTISPENAKTFGRLLVHSPDGRIEPVNSYASEIVRKLHHRDSYRNLSADQVLAGVIADPASWQDEPLLYVKSKELRRILGLNGKYATYRSLFDGNGVYRLGSEVERIYRESPEAKTKTDKDLLQLNEKVNILYALFHGRLFSVFPAENGVNWHSAGESSGLNSSDSVRVAQLMDLFQKAVRTGDEKKTGEAIGGIIRYQQTNHPNTDTARIDAELLYNRMSIFRICFRAYLILGGLLLGFVIGSMFRKGRNNLRLQKTFAWGIFAVFVFQTAGLGLRWYISGHAPWTNAYESMVYVGWATVLSGLIFARRSPLALALAALLGGVVLFVSNLNWLDPQITPLVPVLKSPWLMIHVSVITASYGFFGICTMCGLTSLLALLSGKETGELRTINELAMNIGLVLLTVGIFFGAVWANESWGRYWGWDPKETWALITMLTYAFVTHSHFIPKLNNPFVFSALSVSAFSTVLMTFFGVNYYLSGLHAYGKSEEISPYILICTLSIVILLIIAAGLRYYKKHPN